MKTIQLFLIVGLLVYVARSQVAFTADYQKFNPFFDGGGITTGTITYDPTLGGMKLVYQPNNAVEWYTFLTPLTSLTTICGADSVVSSTASNRTFDSFLNLPSTSQLSLPSSYRVGTTSTGGTCSSVPSSASCTVGTRISAKAVGTNQIQYQIDREDDNLPGGACGCPPTFVTLDVPPCVPCSAVSVTGCVGAYTCGAASANPNSCSNTTGVAQQLVIQLPTTCSSGTYGAFTVTMTGAYASFGTVGIQGNKGTQSCASCAGAAFICNDPSKGRGVTKVKDPNSSCGCETNDISDSFQLPLYNAGALYTAKGPDANTKYGGTTCNRYTANDPSTNNVTTLWLHPTDPRIVCRFSLSNGDTYYLSNFVVAASSLRTALTPLRTCTCLKPVDIIFVVEKSNLITRLGINYVQKYLTKLADYFAISAYKTNIGVISYSPSGTTTDLRLSDGNSVANYANGVNGGLICCATDPNSPCCSAAASLTSAFSSAATQLAASVAGRAYASKNVIWITAGGFTETDTQMDAVIKNLRSTVGVTVNLFTVGITTDTALITRLNKFKTISDNVNYPAAAYSTGPTQYDLEKYANRVIIRNSAANIDANLPEVFGGVCGANGKSCGRCCGDCTCSSVCVPPNLCRQIACFNVSLVPTPSVPNTCCDYQKYNCPGTTTNPCKLVQCDPVLDVCSTVDKQCPPSNDCYNYVCNSANGNCDPVPKFSNPNPCNISSCQVTNSSYKVIYTPVSCPSVPCSTVKCNTTTGNCDATPNPQSKPTACHVATCNVTTNTWVYTLNCPPPSDICQVPVCPSGSCTTSPKCGVSDACVTRTCNSTTGACTNIGCSPYEYITSSGTNYCRLLSTTPCSTSTGCQYTNKVCPTPTDKCKRATCEPSTGNCIESEYCSPYDNSTGTQNLCKPRTCNQNTYTCTYASSCNPPNTTCASATCDPAIGQASCTVSTFCPYYDESNVTLGVNKCRYRSTCYSAGNCSYINIPCTPTNSCYSVSCNPATGACVQSINCGFYNGSDKCQVRNTCFTNGTCAYKTPCVPTNSCMVTTNCDSATGACTYNSICPYYEVNNTVTNYCRTRSACSGTNCTYVTTSCITPTNTCLTSSCNPLTGSCSNAEFCPYFENGTNLCRIRSTCNQAAKTCTYTDRCPQPANQCTINNCNATTGACYTTATCPTTDTSVYQYGNNCTTRTSCVRSTLNCTYGSICNPTNSCTTATCNVSIGAASCVNNIPMCPYFDESNVTIGVNRCRVRSQCFGVNNCTYVNLPCTPTNSCETASCDPATGACIRTPICPYYENGSNLCRNRTSCSGNTCVYSDVNCLSLVPTNSCTTATCNPTTGCSYGILCPYFNNSNCQYRTSCNATSGVCAYTNLCNPTNSCMVAPCNNGVCQPQVPVCPYYSTDTNGVVDKCLTRSTCFTNGTCAYTKTVCTNPTNTCLTAQCNSNTGACENVEVPSCSYMSVDGCKYRSACPATRGGQCVYSDVCVAPNSCISASCSAGVCNFTAPCLQFENGNMCRPLSGCSGSGSTLTCSYTNKSCPAPSLNCQMATCDAATGTCGIALNPNYDYNAACPETACTVQVRDTVSKSCCTLQPKCPASTNKCVNVTCTNGVCGNNTKTCPQYPTFTLNGNTLSDKCKVLVGCNATNGNCDYTNKVCTVTDPCLDPTCDQLTGDCGAKNSSRCVDLCAGVNCPVVNCTYGACNPDTGKCYQTNFSSCTQPDQFDPPNYCIISSCSVAFGCQYEQLDVGKCEQLYGPPPACAIWGIRPTNPKGCCQLLPLCNDQFDEKYLCMKLVCDNTTNGQCQLRDANRCPQYQNNNKCFPLKKCVNETGDCVYDDLNINCQAQVPDPCMDAFCDPVNGSCYFVNTTRCEPESLCKGSNCTVDACHAEVCDEADGICKTNYTKTCTQLNNCTVVSCDPVNGCINTPINITTSCSNSDKCKIVVANPNITGCCDTKPKCTVPDDALCNKLVCDPLVGDCVVLNYTQHDVCPKFETNGTTVNYCRNLTGCSYGACFYQDYACAAPSACEKAECDPQTGKCIVTDLCPKDICQESTCNRTTGQCQVSFQRDCFVDKCTTSVCIAPTGCINQPIPIDTCPPPPSDCYEVFGNLTKDGCCDYTLKCKSTNPCIISKCDNVSNTCVDLPACASRPCHISQCVPDYANNNFTCSYTYVPCVAPDICSDVLPCVENDTATHSCTAVPIVCPQPNKCKDVFCNATAASVDERCVSVDKAPCEDGNPCTADTCDPATGECVFTDLCVSNDKCVEVLCNFTTGCVFTNKSCDDYNACTKDSCLDGVCIHENITCDDNNNCTVDSCDSSFGCTFAPRVCGSDVNGTEAAATDCSIWTCNVSCTLIEKQCNGLFTTTEVIATTVGVGAIVGIIIAIVACVAGSAGTGYAVKQKMGHENLANVSNNPLFKGTKNSMENPLFKSV
eukprot:TRINITY_DN3316_c0_g1_i1.p1 TRINITY_DN3316_c0_g1~~TRINITY_DN3316_c0_g1_i1.p1  ORF type:complete len:2425 (-),score=517.38 TRINITY_DN3316_c0_g1_i1:128-7402(-)